MSEEKKSELVRGILERLNDKHGYVSSELLVKEAAGKRHPLHDFFDWDDAAAAHCWRLEQAALMIRATKFVVFLNQPPKEPLPVKLRVWVSEPGEEGHYKQRVVALKEEDIRADFIDRKLGVLQSWCDETVDIEEFHELRTALIKSLVRYWKGAGAKEQSTELAAVN